MGAGCQRAARTAVATAVRSRLLIVVAGVLSAVPALALQLWADEGPVEAGQGEDRGALRVALLQAPAKGDDEGENLQRAEDYCRRAAEAGADVAVLPELFQIGYQGCNHEDAEAVRKWQDKAIDLDHPWIRHLQDLARSLDMAIGVTYLARQEGEPGNALTLFDRHGEPVLTYHKVHVFDGSFETACEPGDYFVVRTLDTRHGPVEVGAMICYDREFPSSVEALAQNGAEVILTPSADHLKPDQLRDLGQRSAEHRVAICLANYPKPFKGGASLAFGPTGELLAIAGEDEELLIVDIDLEALRRIRTGRPAPALSVGPGGDDVSRPLGLVPVDSGPVDPRPVAGGP